MKNKIRLTPYFISLISPIGVGTLLIFSWLYILPIIFVLFFLRFYGAKLQKKMKNEE